MSEIVTTVGPGGYFGELGFLFGSPRTASVRAGTHCELIMFSREDLNCVIESFPLIAKSVDQQWTLVHVHVQYNKVNNH